MVPKACRKCAAPYLERAGFGTEKVEEQLAEAFPQARIARVDRDSVRRKGVLVSLLSRFEGGELDILVGTQMIAKGHDFPNVTLVGVVAADAALSLPDFRAAERTFQLLTQVAGRSGRGDGVDTVGLEQASYDRRLDLGMRAENDRPIHPCVPTSVHTRRGRRRRSSRRLCRAAHVATRRRSASTAR